MSSDTADHLSSAPTFSLGSVTFRCWVTDNGQRYEWRSTCGRYFAGRNGAHHWSSTDRNLVGSEFPTLKAAMQMAINVGRAKAA